MSAEMSGVSAVYTVRAKNKAKALDDKSRAALLELAKKSAPDPTIFDEKDPYFFTVSASNRSVDSYFTTMDESSLVNYAADATDPGVQFQNSHSVRSVGFGRSLSGEVVGRGQNQEVLVDFYTISGLAAEGVTSDMFIDGSRSGVYKDVSIGFMPGQMICNICGNDFLRKWEVEWGSPEQCQHWPGVSYKVERGKKTVETVCILNVVDGHLNEVSFVYDGATPGAGIVAVDMARMISANGKLADMERQAIENIYRVRIAPPPGVFGGVDLDSQGRAVKVTVEVDETTTTEETVDETVIDLTETTVTEDDRGATDPMTRLAEKYKGTGIRLGRDPHKAIERLADVVLEQRKEITNLERDAQDGRDYREATLKDMDAAVVRAYGQDEAEYQQKRYRRLMDGESIEEIRTTITDLEKRSPFVAGRQTTEVVETDDDDKPTPINKGKRPKTDARLTGM